MTLKKQENKITLIHVELFVFDWDLGGDWEGKSGMEVQCIL